MAQLKENEEPQYIPTRFSAIQFGFFESGALINTDLETNDDL